MECELDSHGDKYIRESSKAAAMLGIWYELALNGTPLNNYEWSDHAPVDSFCPHGEAFSKASGLTPPRCLRLSSESKRNVPRWLPLNISATYP
ncbi:hypothetical protein CJH20_07925 [Salmonella enterica]|nr:hypothetical protein [Salmonella enterica]